MFLFVLRNQQRVEACFAKIRNLQVGGEEVWEVVVRPFKQNRSNEQLGLYWVRVSEIAEQVYVHGQKHSKDVWHEWLKREYLPEQSASGVHKWTFLPNGERVLGYGTGRLNVGEFSDYLTQVEAFGARMGVCFGEKE